MATITQRNAKPPIPETLAEFCPELAAEEKILGKLQAELDKLIQEGQKRNVEPQPQTLVSRLASQFRRSAAGTPEQPDPEASGPTLLQRTEAARLAVENQKSKLAELRRRETPHFYEVCFAALHRAKRIRLARAIAEVGEAIADENAFAEKMTTAGALSSPQYRETINTAQIPQLWRTFSHFRPAEFRRDNSNLLKD